MYYDFICLCCGARNGEVYSWCSFHKYVTDEAKTDSEEYRSQLAAWLSSADYKGSLLVPADYLLTEEHRQRILEMTEQFRSTRTGILLFGLPGVEIPPHAACLSRFLN